MKPADERRSTRIEGHLARFDRRLAEILGAGRISREEKRAKAEAAARAVEELVDDIKTDLVGYRPGDPGSAGSPQLP